MGHEKAAPAQSKVAGEPVEATRPISARNSSIHSPIDWLPTILERIVPRFHPVRIILFGSHARGTPRPDSDLDLLVVLPQAPNKRRAAVEIMRALRDLPVSKDILVSTPAHLAERAQINGLVYKTALAEGKVVYERP
jgi:predicted nucleotidyltransferase